MRELSYKHIYISEAKVDFHRDSLEHFIGEYSPLMQELDVTGFIAYRRRTFFHLLEGADDKVQTLMNLLRRDDRHTVTRELIAPPTKERIFPRWHMKHIVNIEHASLTSRDRLQVKNYWDTMLPLRML